MRKITLFIFFVLSTTMFLLASDFAYSQASSANYTFSTTTTGSLAADLNANIVDMTSGTTQISSSSTDQGVNASAISIGFDFFMMGNKYTQFNATTNGLVSLSSTSTSASGSGYLVSAGTTTTPIISAFAADLGTGTSGKTHYKVVGTAPNRCLVIEFSNMTLLWTASYTNDGTFQVRLYESTGVIEFVYGAMSITSTASASDATVGIGFATNTTTNNLRYITSSSNTSSTTASFTDNSTYSTGAITNLNSAANGSRRTYVMTPPAPTAAPTSLTFTSVGVSAMTLNWTDNSSNELGFAIYRSTDNVTFTHVTTTAANAVTSVQSGLSPSTTYYWKVYAVTEGKLSSALSNSQATGAPSLSGTKTVGTTGNYASITAALTDISNNGLAGPITLSLQSTYVSSVETFPLAFAGTYPGLSASNTITVQPSSTGLSITSNNATGTINMNGAQYVTIDGRVNGTGSTVDLVVANTVTTGYAIQFVNDATSNRVQYCNVQGVNTSATSGVVVFSTTTGANGNDGNALISNTIKDGATTPLNCIYSLGTTTTTATNNSNDTIINCNISNFYHSSNTTFAGVGINLGLGNTDWYISGNSLYQTSTRSTFGAAATWNGIFISNSTSGNNFQILNNYIGGTAPSCGSTALTLTAATTLIFRAIQLTVGATTATSIQGNTIQNFAITTTSASTVQSGISLTTGKFNVGTVTPNTIGSGTGTGSITFSCSGTAAIFSGIVAGTGTPDNTSLTNNVIGSISVSGSGTCGLRGISFQGSTGIYTVSGNTIGSTSTANSLSNSTNAQSFGIFAGASATTSNHQVTTNTIANITTTGTSTANTITGMLLQGSTGGAYTVTGNTIRNITSSSTATGTGSTSSIIGISYTAATTGGSIVQQNIIHTLVTNPNVAATAVAVTGIHYNGPTTGTNLIARNFIHSLTSNSTSTSSVLTGINVAGGTSTFQNNMVRLGINAAGSSITAGYTITGINDASGTNNYLHNSVYIGGTGVTAGTSNSVAFLTAVTLNTRVFRNNIFINEKTNSGGTGFHLAAQYAGTFPSATGLTLSNNLYYSATSSTTIRGTTAATNYTISGWQAASSLDASSAAVTSVSQISFVNATGDATAVDLHLTGTTAAEGSGTASNTATDDYDGQTRSGLTPVDIGADAGNFTAADVTPPTITYTVLTSDVVGTSRTLSGFATITDNVGVSTGASLPRLYYKKSTDNDAFVGNTNADNGWKYVVAGNSSTPFDFVIDYTILNGGSVAAGNTIQYFVVAQDAANNLGSQPAGATSSTNPPVQNINGKATTPNSYSILGSISGTKTVGSGGDYATLTLAITDLNSKVLNGALVLSLTDASYAGETVPMTINANTGSSATNTVTIKPASGVTAAITGTSASAILVVNGADYVTIDGSNNGSTSRNLTITNTNVGTSSALVWLQTATADGATNNTVKNCILTGSGNTQTLFGVGMGSSTISTSSLGTGNNTNTIQNNNISKTQYGIYTQGASAGSKNTGNVISNNLMNTASPNNVKLGGIQVGFETSLTISGNQIDGITNTTSPDVFGIAVGLTAIGSTSFTGNEVTNATISKNLVTNITNTGTFSAVGISLVTAASGTNEISNNVIYGVAANGTSGDFSSGIILGGGTGSTTNVYYNTVSMQGTIGGGTAATQTSSCIAVTNSSSPTLNIKDNILSNTQLGNTSATLRFCCIALGYSTYTGLTSNYNDMYCTGAGPGTYTTGITGTVVAGTNQTALSNWQSTTSNDANSVSGNPIFTSSTDLNISQAGPAYHTGNPIGGITTDYTGATRNGSTPSMGAYENGVNAGPQITYTPLGNGLVGQNQTLSTTIIDVVDGVPTSGAGLPVLYYKVNAGAYSTPGVTATYVSGNTYTFSFGSATTTAGDVVSYYIVAQDGNATPFTTCAPSTGASGFSINPPAVSTPPTSPSTFTAAAAFSGAYTIGTGGSYTTIAAAVTALNAGIITGATTFTLTNSSYSETYPITINALTGASPTNTVKFKPSTTATITGSGATAGFVLNGASDIIFDGSNSGGTDKSMTIANTNTSGTVVTFQNNADSNTIKNCIINGVNSSTSSGSILFSTTASGTAGNSYNTIQNNDIGKGSTSPANCICNSGTTLAKNANNIIIGNRIFDFSLYGIGDFANSSKNTYTQNEFYQTANQTVTTVLSAFSPRSTDIDGFTFTRNYIHDLKLTTSASSVYGLFLYDISSADSGYIANNIISISETTPTTVYGIYDNSASGEKFRTYHNSVYLGGTVTGASNSATFYYSQTSTHILRNNIFMNARNGGTGKHYAIKYITTYTNINSNYNDLYNAGGTGNVLGYDGSADQSTLAGLRTATGKEANSVTGDPNFSSTTTLVPLTSASFQIVTLNSATNTFAGGVTTDYTGATRDASYPDMGAYEFTANITLAGNIGSVTMPGGTYSGFTCGNASNVITFSNPVTIDGTLTLSNGRINLGSNTMTIGTGTGNPGGLTYTSGSITGTLKRWFASGAISNVVFPIDNGTGTHDYVGVNISFTALSTGGTLTASYTTSGSGSFPGGSIDVGAVWPGVHFINLSPQFWTVNAADGLAGFTYNIDLNANNMNVSTTGSNYIYTGVVKRNTGGGNTWGWNSSNHSMTTGSGTSPIMHGSGFGSFSDFAIGGNIDNLLPVELSTFTASVDKRYVNLKWTTATEENNIGFDIERKPAGTETWSKINFVKGNGTSNTPHNYNYEDRNLMTGKYNYRLKQMDNNGNYKYHLLTSTIEIGVPTKYDMSQNYPNPFNPTTKINYDLPFDSKVSIRLFDITGREVATILNETVPAGYQTIQFNASNLSSGTYFYNIIAEGSNNAKYITTKKMVLVK